MKYLCLLYDDETEWERMSQEEMDAVFGEHMTFSDSHSASGHILGGEALQPSTTATTIRVRNGRLSTTDGPFVESKEQLGGYYLLDAKDLNEAIQIASKIPSARSGAIEVRPVMDVMNPTDATTTASG
jgi:hypothetical protein